MSFSKELLDKYAPEAECIQAMKIWKLPDGKENLFPNACNSGDYFAELKKDGYWYELKKLIIMNIYLVEMLVLQQEF